MPFTPAVLDALVCPVCRGPLRLSGRSLSCAARHTFDLARQGYAALLTGSARNLTGDSAPMVAARDAFLSAGHFAPLARALARICVHAMAEGPGAALPEGRPGPVLDAGTGTGYYLASVLDALPPGAAYGLGLDVSPYALRRAARAHPGLAAARWDVRKGLPVADASVPLVLNVFAPRNARAFRRALRPDGKLVVVVPTERHGAELRIPLGLLSVDPAKSERLRLALSEFFREMHSEVLEYSTSLTSEDIYPLVAMGPSAHHVDPAELALRLRRMRTPVCVTSSFRLAVHHPR